MIRSRATAAELATTVGYIDATGLSPWLEQRLIDMQPSVGGRPRQLTVRGLLALLFLVARSGQPLHLERVYELAHALADDADSDLLAELGIINAKGRAVTYRQVASLFDRMALAVDPSPHQFCELGGTVRSPHRLTPSQRAAVDAQPEGYHRCIADQLTTDQELFLADNWLALKTVWRGILRPSVPSDAKFDTGAYSVDATSLPAYARGLADPDDTTDPDAGWSVKAASGSTYVPVGGEVLPTDGTKPRRVGAKGHGGVSKPRQKTSAIYAYEIHLLTRVPEVKGRSIPNVIERILVFGGGRSQAREVAAEFEEISASGGVVREVIADRWYSSKLPENFHRSLRGLGARITQDYRSDERLRQGVARGVILKDGEEWCPATPDELLDLKAPYYKSMAAITKTIKLVTQRSAYVASVKQWLDRFGKRVVVCPARDGKVRCPLYPPSMHLPFTKPTIPPDVLPASPHPDICTKDSIVLGAEVNEKTRQAERYLSKRWWESFNRRPYAEGEAALLKNPGVTDIHSGSFQVRGIAKVSILFAIWAAAANITSVDAFDTLYEPVRARRPGTEPSWQHYRSRSMRRRLRRRDEDSVMNDFLAD